MSETCPRTIHYAPFDGETGRDLPEIHVHCTLPPNHTGFHMGNDRMPFGPWIGPTITEETPR